MKTIYIDSTYMCHATDDGAMQPVETEVFDHLCAGAIECYRLIPEGQTWTRPDGRVFYGPFIQATRSPDAIQRQYEKDMEQMADMREALEILGVRE